MLYQSYRQKTSCNRDIANCSDDSSMSACTPLLKFNTRKVKNHKLLTKVHKSTMKMDVASYATKTITNIKMLTKNYKLCFYYMLLRVHYDLQKINCVSSILFFYSQPTASWAHDCWATRYLTQDFSLGSMHIRSSFHLYCQCFATSVDKVNIIDSPRYLLNLMFI